VFAVPEAFAPEFVNAFEIGSKNTFGALQLNLTGFYYQYKQLQLSRIVARTSVNDNVDADIWGIEAEAVIRPVSELLVNITASYLNTKVASDKFVADPRDFGGGRADAVIIKDITNGANCAVASASGNVAGVNGYVAQVNNLINAGAIPGVSPGAGLRAPTSFGPNSGIASTGAFGICAALQALAPTVGAACGGIETSTVIDGVTYDYSAGIPVNIKGNKLPGAPDYKVSMGIQYAARLGDFTLTPRADVAFTGETTGNIFGGNVNRVRSFVQANAQLQLNAPDERWYVRAFVQNIFDNSSITGLYVTDQSSGNYTNIFTLEPRRYGIAAGFKALTHQWVEVLAAIVMMSSLAFQSLA
jgi:iron complex outermembrane recepter protein